MSHKSSHSHKGRSIGPDIRSFLLFAFVVVLSMSVCARVFIVNPKMVSDMFTSKDYVDSLYDDVMQYATDECERCYIPASVVEDAISYDSVYNAQASYIHYALGTSNAYSVEAFDGNLDSIKSKIIEAVDDFMTNQGVDYKKANADNFANKITGYIQSKVQFAYMDKLQTLISVFKTLSVVMAVISAIITIALIASLYLDNQKKYRSIRRIAFSFEAAAIFDLLIVAAIAIVRIAKDLVIYPSYLCDAVMGYVNSIMIAVSLSAIVLVFVALVLMTAVWRIKRDEQ